MEAISLDKVNFSYEKTPILIDVTFSVKENSFIAIIGPNGGGKTTLLKLLMGFLKVDSGQILLKGLTPENTRKKIGYVPQSQAPDMNFPITTLDLVLLGCLEQAKSFGKYPKPIIEKAHNLLEKFNLQDHSNKPFGSLSGGLMQRAMIAKALISDPEFLFLDEPTANIDPETQKEIFETLSSLKKEKTILMVTHDLNAVMQNVDSVISINHKADVYLPKEVCEHFTLGLYHAPLIKEDAK